MSYIDILNIFNAARFYVTVRCLSVCLSVPSIDSNSNVQLQPAAPQHQADGVVFRAEVRGSIQICFSSNVSRLKDCNSLLRRPHLGCVVDIVCIACVAESM